MKYTKMCKMYINEDFSQFWPVSDHLVSDRHTITWLVTEIGWA